MKWKGPNGCGSSIEGSGFGSGSQSPGSLGYFRFSTIYIPPFLPLKIPFISFLIIFYAAHIQKIKPWNFCIDSDTLKTEPCPGPAFKPFQSISFIKRVENFEAALIHYLTRELNKSEAEYDFYKLLNIFPVK